MKYQLAIFDMDGTILNTLDDLTDSLNYALSRSHYPTHQVYAVRGFVGDGIRKLIERGMPANSDDISIDVVYNDFISYYSVHCADKTRPYDGIINLITTLRTLGLKTAVVSNKAHDAVQRLCSKYFPSLFDIALGDRPTIHKKPAPDAVIEIMSTLNIPRDATIYIGDSTVDLATARNANIDNISVDWGFCDRIVLEQHNASRIVSTPADIVKIIC